MNEKFIKAHWMESKNQRLAHISDIIQNEQVTSQEQLLKTLLSQGFAVTQATLSRDLKKLKIAKVPSTDGTYQYVLPNSSVSASMSDFSGSSNILNGLISVELSANMGVIKTIPAFSSTISAAIDSRKLKSLAGTIAGDDTIFFVIREKFSHSDVKKELIEKFPELENKLK